MKRHILITGGHGFLGRALAFKFKQQGHYITGVGHGSWGSVDFHQHGFDNWLNLHVNMANLLTMDETFDMVIHCAGSSAVSETHANPLTSYYKTVQSTAELLDYLRLHQPSAQFIYPSSAAVYGAVEDLPIKESARLNPISPYGYHKKIIEELCDLYVKIYGLKISIVRFFSIYGPGLQKQLLWDAASKLSVNNGEIVFCGSGAETRDWIHIEDAANLILKVSEQNLGFTVLNGAAGIRVTIKSILEMLRDELNPKAKIRFNNIIREGDPRYYFADISKTKQINWMPKVLLRDGITEYLDWFRTYHNYG